MKILITGGAGFIGSNIANEYIKKGYDVTILDNFSTGKHIFCHDNTKICRANIHNQSEVEKAINKYNPDIVSHHAAHISLRNSFENPAYDAAMNIIGTINVLKASIKKGVKHFIFASSGGAMVNKHETNFPAKEVEQPKPESPYGLSKYCAERYISQVSHGHKINVTIFRYANIYGENQLPKSGAGIISIFCDHILKKKIPKIFGDGKQKRDFLHVSDVVNANFLAVEKKINGLYNLGSGDDKTILQVYNTISEKLNFKKPPQFQKAISGEILQNSLDSTKFKKISDWKPKVNFNLGIDKTINWYKNFLKNNGKKNII